jgi:hypothetical protein
MANAKDGELRKLRKEAKAAARKSQRRMQITVLRPVRAIREANKLSKSRSYPLPPYQGLGEVAIFRWLWQEWKRLGRYQRVATPVLFLVGFLTWQQERETRRVRLDALEKADVRRYAAELYGGYGVHKRRKLFGKIPLPGRRARRTR